MNWTDMMVWGGRVSAEWQKEAWEMTPANDLDSLRGALFRTFKKGRDAPPPDDGREDWYCDEIANRMRQKAKRAGVIEFSGKPRKWRVVE